MSKKTLVIVLMLVLSCGLAYAADLDSQQRVILSDIAGDEVNVTGTSLDVNVTAGATSPSKVDDAAFVIATDNVSPMGLLVDETTPDSADEGDVALARMTADRKQLNVLVDATTDTQRLAISAGGSASVNVTNSVIPVSDNAGSLTVDNPTLSVVGGGAEATALRVTVANDSTGVLSIDDNGGSLTVDGTVAVSSVAGTVSVTSTDLDIRDLTSVSDSVAVLQATRANLNANATIQIAGTDVSTSVPVPTREVPPAVITGEVANYDTSAAIASNATDNHDYTVTGTTFFLKSVIFSASQGEKVEIQTGPVASLVTRAVAFSSPSAPSGVVEFNPPVEVPVTSTGTVRVIRTNRDNQAQDVYSTIVGYDI